MKNISIEVHGKKINATAENDYLYQHWVDVEKGTLEPDTFKLFSKYIDKETTFIDMGAYIGYTSLFGAQLAKKAFAFEPDPIAFANLEANLNLNPHIDNLKIFSHAVGMSEGVTHIKSTSGGGNSGSSIMIDDFSNSWEVKLIDINKFIRDNVEPGKLFIKIDIEGFEYQLFKYLLPIIQEYKPTIFLAIHPQIMASSVKGNSIISKIKRRLMLVRLHKDITSIVSHFPHTTKIDGTPYPMQELNDNIRNKGRLKEEDKEILMHF